MTRPLIVFALLAVVLSAPTAEARSARMQPEEQCFPETGLCISGRFRDYWLANGGLAVFGYPITVAREEATAEGTFLVQYFERNRFELHADLAPPYDVSLGRLGDQRLQQLGRDWFTFPRGEQTDACRWFAATNHSVCAPFRDRWERAGTSAPAAFAASMALYGMPLSEPAMETNAAGDTVLTQWFERARFEYHLDNPEPYMVQLGLLGTETFGASALTPEKCGEIPPLLNAEIRPSNCVLIGTTIKFDIYGFRPNETIEFRLLRPDGTPDGPDQTYMVGVSGAIDGLSLDTSGLAPGLWTWYFRGRGSDHESVVPFKVIAP